MIRGNWKIKRFKNFFCCIYKPLCNLFLRKVVIINNFDNVPYYRRSYERPFLIEGRVSF